MIKPHFTIGDYLHRWFLTPWSRDEHRLKHRRLPNIYLHKILKDDDARGLHDHPWPNMSIILWGGYNEYMFERPAVAGVEMPNIIVKRRRMFSIIRRKAEDAHRLELYRKTIVKHYKSPEQADMYFMSDKGLMGVTTVVRPCWSIFITWRKTREWGFWCVKSDLLGWTDHKVPGTEDTVRISRRGKVAKWVHQATFQKQNGCGVL